MLVDYKIFLAREALVELKLELVLFKHVQQCLDWPLHSCNFCAVLGDFCLHCSLFLFEGF